MRTGLIAICFFIAAQAALATPPSPPPPPPPPPESLAAATAIWRDHPLPENALNSYAQVRIRENVVSMMTTAKVRPGSKKWFENYPLLERHFWEKISPDVESKNELFIECLATPYAWMKVEQLHQLRAFLNTDAGREFWRTSRLADKDAFLCGQIFQADIERFYPEGWRLIGAKPPPPPPAID